MAEVFLGPDAAPGPHACHQPLRQGAGIEARVSLTGQGLQRPGQVRLTQPVSLGRRLAVHEELARGRLGSAQGVGPKSGEASVVGVHVESIPRERGGGRQAPLQGQATVALTQVDEGGRDSGDARRQGAVQRQLGNEPARRVQIQVPMGREGSSLAPVDHHLMTVGGPVEQPESASAESRSVGLDHAEGGAHRDGRVEGVPARGEDRDPRPGGRGVGGRDG